MLFVAPELLMGNRVLRLDAEKYPLEKFLRVVFRDDDGKNIRSCIKFFFLNRSICPCCEHWGRSY